MTHPMVDAWAKRAPVPDWIALAAVLEACAGIVVATHPRLPIVHEVLAEALAIRYGASPQTLVVLADEHTSDVLQLMRGSAKEVTRNRVRQRSMQLLQDLEENDPTFRDRLFSFDGTAPSSPPQRVTKPLPAVDPDTGHPLVRAFSARAHPGFVPPPGLSKYLVESVARARYAKPQLPLDDNAFVGMLAGLFAARPDLLEVVERLKADELHLARSCATSDVARTEICARFASAVRRICENYVTQERSINDVTALFWGHLFSAGSDPRALTLEQYDGTCRLEDFVLYNGLPGLLLHAQLTFTLSR